MLRWFIGHISRTIEGTDIIETPLDRATLALPDGINNFAIEHVVRELERYLHALVNGV